MSGGSWDYVYQRFEEAAERLEAEANALEKDPRASLLRKPFAAHLRLVAKAMHDIEWVDSGDLGARDEEASILAVLTATRRPFCD